MTTYMSGWGLGSAKAPQLASSHLLQTLSCASDIAPGTRLSDAKSHRTLLACNQASSVIGCQSLFMLQWKADGFRNECGMAVAVLLERPCDKLRLTQLELKQIVLQVSPNFFVAARQC